MVSLQEYIIKAYQHHCKKMGIYLPEFSPEFTLDKYIPLSFILECIDEYIALKLEENEE